MGRIARPRISGVYAITCIPTSHSYIGSAVDLEGRRRVHFNKLQTGKHHNKVLQFAFDVFGENNFEWRVLEKCDKSRLQEREYSKLRTWKKPLFNLLRDPRVPRREFSIKERQELSERARRQHAAGNLGRQTWRENSQ